MKTTICGWRRHASLFGLALAGLLAAPPSMAHDTQHPIAVTEGGSQVVAQSAGYQHSCALKANGAVDCWGWDGDGQATDQPGPYVAISAGFSNTCGLTPQGAVDCWGSTVALDQPGPYVAVSAGYLHVCALKPDGAADCWGNGDYGQAADQPGPFVSLSAGAYHSCGVKADGTVACWGAGTSNSGVFPEYGQSQAPAGRYLSVSAGAYHTCALRADGAVDCWGLDSEGQAENQPGPFLSLSAGVFTTCGLKVDGNVVCWGQGAADHAGPYVSVSTGFVHGCGAKADGGVDCWGGNDFGQITVPAAIGAAGSTSFGQIAAGNAHACQVKPDGTLACWGSNDEGQADAPEGLFTQVVAGDSHGCAIGTDGKVTCWGRNGAANTQNALLANGVWRQLAPRGKGSICALSAAQDIAYCLRDPMTEPPFGFTWGGESARNITGLFASSSNSLLCGVSLQFSGKIDCVRDSADPIPPAGQWQRMEAGIAHQCGLKADGSIECWGDNTDNQLANAPASTETFRAFSVGWNHACAIRDDGTLKCWGNAGNGKTTPPSGTYVQVAAGNTFTCAIRSDGVRVCWGDDSHGQAPQLALGPASIADGLVGTAHAGAGFGLVDASPSANASEPYGSAGAAYAVTVGSLPPGLSLTAGGVLGGTPTTAGSYSFTVEGEDANGFTASRSYTVAIADGTPPQIDYTITSLSPGSNGWYTGNVTVTWSVVDPESTAVIDSGCGTGFIDTLAADTSNAGVTFSCTAHSAGGSTGPVTVTLKRDATAPTITVTPSPAANGNGWHKTDVTLLASCGDATPGSSLAGACPTLPNVTTEGTTNVPAQQVSDNAGNTGYSNALTIKLDKTAPTLNPTVPGLILAGGTVTASPNASDALSGIASASCTPLDTGSAGTRTATCTATDNAGNTASATVTYKVTSAQFQWQQPLLPVLYSVNANQRVLLQWRLVNTQGGWVTTLSAASVTSTPIACPSSYAVDLPAYTGSAIELEHLYSGIYRKTWNVTAGQPQALRTLSGPSGSCLRMNLDVGDGKPHTVLFKLK